MFFVLEEKPEAGETPWAWKVAWPWLVCCCLVLGLPADAVASLGWGERSSPRQDRPWLSRELGQGLVGPLTTAPRAGGPAGSACPRVPGSGCAADWLRPPADGEPSLPCIPWREPRQDSAGAE